MLLGARQFFERRGAPTPSVPTARDYVQNGLIAMWDGIENAGWGTHDASATTWKDLIGANDLDTMNGNTFGTNFALISNERLGIGSASKRIDLYTGTVELVCEPNPVGSSAFVVLGGYGGNYALGLYYSRNRDGTKGVGGNVLTTGVSYSQNQRYYTATYDGTNYVMYVDGLPAVANVTTSRVVNTINIGGAGGRTHSLNGKVFCVRVYNTVLSAAQISSNNAIDKARFNLP